MKLNSWEDPISFEENELPSFPLEAFPTWLKDYLEGVAKELKTTVDMPAMSALSLLSKMFTRKYKFYLEATNWLLNLNLYILVAATSGSNKTAVHNKTVFPLDYYGEELMAKKLENIPALKNKLEIKTKQAEHLAMKLSKKSSNEMDVQKREDLLREIESIKKEMHIPIIYLTGNITTEKLFNVLFENNGTTAIISDEFSELLNIISGKYSNKVDVDLLLKGYDGSRIDVGRAKHAEIRVVENPLITIGVFTQPVVLKEFKSMSGRGLAERFLFSMPKNKFSKGLGIKNNEDVIKTYEKNISNLIKVLNSEDHKEQVIQLDDVALEAYIELFNKVEKEKHCSDNPEILKGWYAKLIAKLMKVITILNITKQLSSHGKVVNTKLGKADIALAEKLFHYFEAHARKAFGIVNNTLIEDDALYLIEKISTLANRNKRKIVTRTELQQNTKRKFNRREREELIEFLVDLNYIRLVKVGNRTEINLNPRYKKST